MSVDSVLLTTIETEILQTNQSTYQKVIPIKNYNYETKRTLDYLIDKYGGFINRYDDKVIIFIHENKVKKAATVEHQDEQNHLSRKFDRLNNSINEITDRLSLIEEKVNQLSTLINENNEKDNINMESYLSYFRNKTEKREISRLVDEIVSHH